MTEVFTGEVSKELFDRYARHTRYCATKYYAKSVVVATLCDCGYERARQFYRLKDES